MKNLLDHAIKTVKDDIRRKTGILAQLMELRSQVAKDSAPFVTKVIKKTKAAAGKPAKKKRKLSKEARARIAEAQRKRWALKAKKAA